MKLHKNHSIAMHINGGKNVNYTKFALKILAFLIITQSGIVLPMEPIVNQPADAQPTKTDTQKEEKLSPEELAALEQEINAIQGELDLSEVLTEQDDRDLKKIIDEINHEQGDNTPKQNNKPAPNAFIPGLENLMPELDKATKAFEKEQERAKYQNTILLGHPKCPIALYRRDIIELPFFAADIAIAYLFFENIKSKRVDYLYHSLTEDTAASIEMLTHIKEAQKTLENQSATTQEKEEATLKLIELLTSLTDKHSYVGNNPFKLEIVIPFLSAILGHKLSRYAQEQCIVKGSFAPEAQYAYTQDENGNYQRFEMEGYFATPTMDDWENTLKTTKKNRAKRYTTGRNQDIDLDEFANMAKAELQVFQSLLFPGNAPMSTMGAIKGKFIENPNANPFVDQMPDASEQLHTFGDFLAKGMYKLAGLPDWLYEVKNSRAARFAMEVAILATMTTYIDDIYNTTWMEYIEKNIDTLIPLLRAHETVKNLPKEHVEKQAVRKEISEFIQTGNTCASWKDAGTKFFFHKTMGRMNVLGRIQAWTITTIAASLLWKSRSLIKFGFMAAKNNMLPAETWLVGGLVTAYMSILIVPITLISATQVYRDVCWMKDKVKDTIKSFFTKKSDDQKKDENPSNTSPVQSNESNTPKEAIA